MSKPLVFVTRRVPQEGIDLLKEKCEVSVWDSDEVIPRETLLSKVRGTSGIFCTLNDKIDAGVLEAAGRYVFVVRVTEFVRRPFSRKRQWAQKLLQMVCPVSLIL